MGRVQAVGKLHEAKCGAEENMFMYTQLLINIPTTFF